MVDPVEEKCDGEVAVMPDSSDERAATKAKINFIWEELKAKDSLPAKVDLVKVQKVVKSCKPCKPIPSWMVNLGLAAPGGSVVHKPGHVRLDKLLKAENVDASNGRPKAIQYPVSSGWDQVKAKESPTFPQIDLSIIEVLTRPRDGADTNLSSALKASEGPKDFKSAQALKRKSEMQASSSSGLDDLLHQLRKKQKPNILDRSRTDWGQFKQEKGFDDDLEAYKKSGDKYLDKVAFLQRSDVREYENERNTRLALQSKRQFETAPLS